MKVTIATAGSVAGLSGAGVTSGLAAIGSVVGGGMGAGIAITVAAPAVVAASVGYGAYKIWQWMIDSYVAIQPLDRLDRVDSF